MLRNYLKLAWRNSTKNKLYSAINIIGLSMGLAVCMLIMLYSEHESNYDVFHKNAKRIFWVEGKINTGNDSIYTSTMSYAMAPLIKQYDPSVTNYLRINRPIQDAILQNPEDKDIKFAEKKFLFADSNFFDFFSFQLLMGKKEDVLRNPFSLVISKKASQKYFGNTNPIGQTIRYKNVYDFIVTGVAEDVPSNSSIDFDFVGSISSLLVIERQMVMAQSQLLQMGSFNTFFLLDNVSSATHVTSSLNTLNKINSENGGNEQSFIVLPLLNMHLNENTSDTSNSKYIKVFTLIALSVLLLGLINYISLSTARSTLRAKEIGIRKVVGASRNNIAIQFFVESLVFSLIAFSLGYIVCTLVQPAFFQYVHINLDNKFLRSVPMLTAFFALLLITVLFASIYPSIVLSGYNPSLVLYGKFSKQAGGSIIRKIFTIFQFVICIVLIICAIVVEKQLYFFKHTETGINRKNIVMIPFGSSVGNHFASFKNEVQSISSIQKTSVATNLLYNGHDTYFVQAKNSQADVPLSVMRVDESYIQMLGLKWKSIPQDSLILNSQNAVLNETAIGNLNFDNNGHDEKVQLGMKEFKVQGVLKDFNYESLQNKINPLCLIISKHDDTLATWANEGGYLYVEIRAHANIPSVINGLENIFKKYEKAKAFEYYFLDDVFDAMYIAEERLAKLSDAFILVTLIIACLGLFGLSTFIAQQRTKEISIRKVMGARASAIVLLLSKDYMKLIIIAFLIASPIAWWVVYKWLGSFVYRVQISEWIFIFTGTATLLIGMLTISLQTIKAALTNPVKNLHSSN